ncbi:MAG: hypothetical protein ABI051_00850 [Vicinamibacterales bacterium]
MKRTSIAVAVAALVIAGPAMAFAQTTTAPKPAVSAPAKKAAPAAAAAVHATKGVVKSIDDKSLVISKVAGKGPDTTFMVNASTERKGTIAAGTSVDVRYRTEGKDKVATAVTAQEMKMPMAKAPAAAKMPASTPKTGTSK